MKLLAQHITHLTDARYFAARGAHYMGFDTDKSSVDSINAIKDWIDLPQFYLELQSAVDAENLWEWSDRTSISNVYSPEIPEEILHHFSHVSWLCPFNNDFQTWSYKPLVCLVNDQNIQDWIQKNEEFRSLYPQTEVFVEIKALDQFDQLNIELFHGIALHGSDEDDVGIKSFEIADTILDQIEIEY